MATPEDLIQTATATGAQVQRKPAWQQLREQGVGGQGSAAANKAKLGQTLTKPAFGSGAGIPPGPTPSAPTPSPFRPLRVGGAGPVMGSGDSPPFVGGDAPPEQPNVSAFRPFRMRPPGGDPSVEAIRQPMAPGEPPMKPDLASLDRGGFRSPDWAPSIGDPNVGKPLANGAPPEPNQSPPWAGLAGLMAGAGGMKPKPPMPPGGGLQSFAPEEGPNGGGMTKPLGGQFPRPRIGPGGMGTTNY